MQYYTQSWRSCLLLANTSIKYKYSNDRNCEQNCERYLRLKKNTNKNGIWDINLSRYYRNKKIVPL